ncbi:pentatricopeptide repeat-containing protein DOT4, chloroplastic [Selaginella moellendorffii]|nr:pentatricopeptide repeat-containing protein DOT4, chloroplastic [Selaginella moellendorffii]|eukprot:XP_002964793.2 pentatricopeptide repeat-containing protein DOT4, chloroplastic [Selaginella moellendorffii]
MSLARRARSVVTSFVYTLGFSAAIDQLLCGRVQVDKADLLYLIKQCGHERALGSGQRLAAYIDRGLYRSDRYVLNLLVDMYGKCCQIRDARLVFDRIAPKNEFSWTQIVKAYAHNGHLLEAILFFRKSLLEGMDPSDYACSIVIGVCCSLGSLQDGRFVHAVVRDRGYESDPHVAAGLIHMYSSCGCMDEASTAFRRTNHRDRFIYTAMIGGFAQAGQCREAVVLFREMDLDGITGDNITFVSAIGAFQDLGDPRQCRAIHECAAQAGVESDCLVQTALLNMYSQCGFAEEALQVFGEMAERDRVAWSSTIAACARHGYGRQAMELFRRMELEGIKPDIVVLSSLLDACSSVEALAEGAMIHARIIAGGFHRDRILDAAILNMYAKCGSAASARLAFDEQSPDDPVSWNVMIGACAKAGLDLEAIESYRQMQALGIDPTPVTFITVLAACSHSGFLAEARIQFLSMIQDFGIAPDVDCYCCLVDLLARTGDLEAGEELMLSMPFEPFEAGWTSLLSACGVHGDRGRATRIAGAGASIAPETSAHYVLLSNMKREEECL